MSKEPVTDQELDELERLTQAATPARWTAKSSPRRGPTYPGCLLSYGSSGGIPKHSLRRHSRRWPRPHAAPLDAFEVGTGAALVVGAVAFVISLASFVGLGIRAIAAYRRNLVVRFPTP